MRIKFAAFLCVLFLMAGCNSNQEPLDRALELRSKITQSNGCSFSATVTADYGEKLYDFSMDCVTDQSGNLSFTVTSPETIAGITGKISSTGGAISFDDKVLAFQTLAEGQLAPVTAPWLLVKTLRSGYLKDCCQTEKGLQISFDDSYEEDSLHLLVMTKENIPVSAEIFWKERRCLTLEIENFSYL